MVKNIKLIQVANNSKKFLKLKKKKTNNNKEHFRNDIKTSFSAPCLMVRVKQNKTNFKTMKFDNNLQQYRHNKSYNRIF